MRRIKIVLLMEICSIVFCACGNQAGSEGKHQNKIVIEEIERGDVVETDGVQNLCEEVAETKAYFIAVDEPSSVAQAFQDVLLNEKKFFCTDKEPYDWLKVVYDFEGFIKDIPYGYTEETSIVQFAIVDMNGDVIPEIVLELEDYYGYIILRYREGQIYGNVVGIRTMNFLNTAGAFFSTAGVVDGGIEKFYFIGDTIVGNEALRRTNQNTFYIQDMISDKETWDEMNNSFDESPKVEWYEFTEEHICIKIKDNPIFSKISFENLDAVNERQQYFDSLYYLLELTYNNSKKNNDEYKKDANEYLAGCVQEMDKIYQLCQDKLLGGELEILQKEQWLWMENFKKRTNIDLEIFQLDSMDELLASEIYDYADIILRRVLVLVNLYYDCNFYDVLF